MRTLERRYFPGGGDIGSILKFFCSSPSLFPGCWVGGGKFTLTCAFKHLQNVRFCALFRLKFFIILFLFYHIFGDIH